MDEAAPQGDRQGGEGDREEVGGEALAKGFSRFLGGSHQFLFIANVASDRKRLAARRLDFFGGTMNRAG